MFLINYLRRIFSRMELQRLIEYADHEFSTLLKRQKELQMKVRKPATVYLRPFSKGNLRPMFTKKCTFPIEELDEAVGDDHCDGRWSEIDRPICYIELNAVHYKEWQERHRIQRRTLSKRRREEEEKWMKWKIMKDLDNGRATIDEYEVTEDDFIMDFS